MTKIRCVVSLVLTFVTLSMSAQEVIVAKYKDGKDCAVSFTFDDGNVDNYTIAAPELEKRGWRGTFWLNCSRIPGEVRQRKHIMTWDNVCDLHSRGHEISNHGWDHRNLTKSPYEEAVREIERNDSAIFAHTGVRPVTFCYAYNAKNDKIIALASEGRVGTRTFQYAFGEQSSDVNLRGRMDKAILKGEWAVWMTHGILRGYDCFKDPSRYASFLDYVKAKESNVWVGTFREVAAYVAERDDIQLTEVRKGRRIKVTPSLSLDQSVYDMPLTMCLTGVVRLKVRQGIRRLPVVYKNGGSYFDFDPHGGKIVINYR